ncbi:MAG TPA: acyl carrier protein [Verrucomicrobiae bacterium]|jgi:acyl carrier protein|nr:acyl carrier protein [Verrucomicrobiae bacterium]
MDQTELKSKIKAMMVENLMLKISASEIGDDQALFGPESLGLDSVDALQLVVALDKTFGLKVPDQSSAKKILENVNSMAAAIAERPAAA